MARKQLKGGIVKKLDYLAPWKNLLAKARQWEYGTLHTHEEIAGVLELEVGTKYYAAVSRANKTLLEEEKKFLDNIFEKGYRVINPNEHVGASSHRVKLATRRAKRALEIAVHTNASKLNKGDQQVLANYLARSSKYAAMLEKGESDLVQISAGHLLPAKDVPR